MINTFGRTDLVEFLYRIRQPFDDGIEWLELTNSNTFPLKEAVILDYNEPQVT